MALKIGFTGTRHGMTTRQINRLHEGLRKHAPADIEFHHGDCVGADAYAALVAYNYGARVISHPPDNPKLRAYAPAHYVLPEKPYLQRNTDIVAACDFIVAAPRQAKEEVRSGTWATIRYARNQGKRVIILEP